MGFKMKKMNDILRDMALWVTSNSEKLTNMRVGSVTRTLLEAVAVEVESLYYEVRKGFSSAVENSILHSFNFYKKPAIPSKDYVTVTFRSPLLQSFTIPKDTRFFTLPVENETIYFRSIENTTASEGSTLMRVLIECETPGIKGNVPPYSIRRMANPSPYILDIYNESRFFNGMPEETTEARKKRFADYIDSLPRGTTPSIVYGCMQVDGIVGATVQEGIGTIRIYAHDAVGNLTPEQKSEIENLLPEYKCAGIGATVSKAVTKEVDMDIAISLEGDVDPHIYTEAIFSSVKSYLNNSKVGKSISRAELIKFIMTIDDAIINTELSIEEDINVLPFELIRAGNISVEVVS